MPVAANTVSGPPRSVTRNAANAFAVVRVPFSKVVFIAAGSLLPAT